MNDDPLLPILLKLVNGDKERCFQLVKGIKTQYPAKSMQWCLQKAVYDLRHKPVRVPPPPPPNPALSAPKPQTWGAKGVRLSQPQTEKPLAISARDLQALAEAKRLMAVSDPSSDAVRRKLFRLMNGDIEGARRLVQRVRVANPQRSEQWAVEKVIYDLERDRL